MPRRPGRRPGLALCDLAPSGALLHLVECVRLETMGLPVDARRGLTVRCVDQAEHLAGFRVEPGSFEMHAFLGLDVQVSLVGGRELFGASPELLVQVERGEMTVRPIAGTRPRGQSQAEDEALERELRADPKENAEHVMLVDLARNDLGRVATAGSVRVDPYRSIERYSHVMHIVSGVNGVLAPGKDAFDLFAAAFPAGTLVGAPKVRAMEIIDELEPVRRGFYGGTVGYFGHGGDMNQAITIRTI